MEIQTIEVKYFFDEDEINKIGRDVAHMNQERKNVEAEKKTVVADFTHQIKELSKEIDKKFDCLNNGFEMREVKARMVNNYSTNEREYYDPISGDLIDRKPIKLSDLDFKPTSKVDDVKEFESKSKAEPLPVETPDENGQPVTDETPAATEDLERLEWNEVEQMSHVDDAKFSRAGREHSANWKIVGVAPSNDVRAFIWLFPELKGTFAEVKDQFDNYIITLETPDAENETSEETPAETESDDQEIPPALSQTMSDLGDGEFADKLSQIASDLGASEITVTGTDNDGNVKEVTVKMKTPRPPRKKYILQSKRNKPDAESGEAA